MTAADIEPATRSGGLAPLSDLARPTPSAATAEQ